VREWEDTRAREAMIPIGDSLVAVPEDEACPCPEQDVEG